MKKEVAMGLTDLYVQGEKILRDREYGWILDAVETGFIPAHDRRILDRYTIRPRYIEVREADTSCEVLGVKLSTPVVMSAMTMPIPAVVEDGMIQVAEGLKEAGSLLWTGTPIPQNLDELVATGVPVAANVKPFRERRKIFEALEKFQAAGVHWVGVEIDAGEGTKIHDRQVASDCVPFTMDELESIRREVSCPLIFKGILSQWDALRALEAGADALVVSNHGAHTLDYLPHPLQVMGDIVEVVRGKIPIIVDGGFRRGSDVFKGLAFGASLVGLGRPILYGLAAAGREGGSGDHRGAEEDPAHDRRGSTL
jgi:isopentenyl diphosphate isomerase/L-lactate dehydrogenase-like FMN-dependent dehydrogenase